MAKRITDEEIRKFLEGCEDFFRLGNSFSQRIREAFDGLKKTIEPLTRSNYVDRAIGDLLEKSLKEFETKMTANLQGIEKVCTKSSQWFPYYLGRRIESDLAGSERATDPEESPEESSPLILKSKVKGQTS